MGFGIIDYRLGYDLGAGLDVLTGEVKGDAVNRPPAEPPADAGGQTVIYSIEQIESVEKFQSALGVSAKGSLGIGAFSGSAKVDFAHEVSVDSYSVFLLVRVSVRNAFRRMRDVTFKPDAEQRLIQGDAAGFRASYGDGFVLGILTGGEFFGVIQIETTGKTEATSLNVKATTGVVNVFSATAELKSRVDRMSQKHNLTVRSFQQGGDTTPVDTVEEMMARAKAFPASVAGGNGVDYLVLTQGYAAIPVHGAPNYVEVARAQRVVENCWEQAMNCELRLNDLSYALSHPEQFEPLDTAALNQARDGLTTAMNVYLDAAEAAAASPGDAEQPSPALPDIPTVIRLPGESPTPTPTPPAPSLEPTAADSVLLDDMNEMQIQIDPRYMALRTEHK